MATFAAALTATRPARYAALTAVTGVALLVAASGVPSARRVLVAAALWWLHQHLKRHPLTAGAGR